MSKTGAGKLQNEAYIFLYFTTEETAFVFN